MLLKLKMWNMLRCTSIILLSIQFFLIVYCAPISLVKRSHKVEESLGQKLTKSQSKFENGEKKSHLNKKTQVSINGQFLPMAELQSSDKNIHVTVQKANPNEQQLQPNVQEVQLGGQNNGQINGVQTHQIGLQNTNTLGMSPGINTNTGNLVGMSPGINTNTGNLVGMSPGINTNTGNLVGMSPGINTNTGNLVGMSPGINTNTGNLVGMHPGGVQNQGIQTNCGPNQQGQGNQGPAILETNSEGGLTYKPLAC